MCDWDYLHPVFGSEKEHPMLRTFASAVVALLLVVGLVFAADKAEKKGKKGEDEP